MLKHLFHLNFEGELETGKPSTFSDPFTRELQFLPCLYCAPDATVLVSDMPENAFFETMEKFRGFTPKLETLNKAKITRNTDVDVWGYSLWTTQFLKRNHKSSKGQSIDLLRSIAGKHLVQEWSSLSIEQELFYEFDAVIQYCKNTRRSILLKHAYACSGSGVRVYHPGAPIPKKFIERGLLFDAPLIAQKYVNIVHEFSSQWEVHEDKSITFIGITECMNSEEGAYLGTIVKPHNETLKNFEKIKRVHIDEGEKIGKKLMQHGYIGNFGIDALITRDPKGKLHTHIIEINARKTMGFVALKTQQTLYPNQAIRFTLQNGKNCVEGLLPKKTAQWRLRKTICIDLI